MDGKRLLKTALGLLLAFTMAFAPLLSSYSVIAFAAGTDNPEVAAGTRDPVSSENDGDDISEAVDPVDSQAVAEEAEPASETPEEETAPSGSSDGSENDLAPAESGSDSAEAGPAEPETADSEEPAGKLTADIEVKEKAEDTLRVNVDNASDKAEDVRIYLWQDHDSFTDGTAKDKIVRKADELIAPQGLDQETGIVKAGDIKLKYTVEKENGKIKGKYLEFTAKAGEKAEFEISFETEKSLDEKYLFVAELQSDTLDADDVIRTALLTIKADKKAGALRAPLKAPSDPAITVGNSVTVKPRETKTFSFTPEYTHEYKFTASSTSYVQCTIKSTDPADTVSTTYSGSLTRNFVAGVTYTVSIRNTYSSGTSVSRTVTLTYGKHTYGEPVWDPAATCTEAGSGIEKCVCGNEHPVTEKALGHNFAEGDEGVETKAPTCTEKGERVYKCTRCLEDIPLPLAALEHDWNEDGVCKRCGTESIKAIIHIRNPYNSEVTHSGFVFEAHPSIEANKYSDDAVSTSTENEDGSYTVFLDPDDSADGKFSMFITAAPEGYSLSTPSSNNYGAGVVDTNLAEDGIVETTFVFTKSGGYGPIYVDAYVYDSVSEKPLSGAKLQLQLEQYESIETDKYKWINQGGSYAAFKESSISKGYYEYVGTSSSSSGHTSIGNSYDARYRVIPTQVPQGYSLTLDKKKTINYFELAIPEKPYNYYVPGGANNWEAKLYVIPQTKLNYTLKNRKTDQAIPGATWTLYADESCTTPVKDSDGNVISGITDANGALLYDEWFDFDWENCGTTAYVKLTDFDDSYTEYDESVQAIELATADMSTGTLYLSPYASEVEAVITVIDSSKIGFNKSVKGRTVKLYEYNSETEEYSDQPIGTLTDNGDGTYSGIKLTETDRNKGEFRAVDEESGYLTTIDISEIYGDDATVTGTIDIAEYGDLITILKKDDEGAYIGDIDLLYNGKILDSTVKEPEYTDAIPPTSVVKAKLYGLAVDEELVEENRIYTYVLPKELVPVLDATQGETVGSEWMYLPKYGNVRAYGRIVEKKGSYIFEVYFLDTKGQYDIEFGYSYDAKLSKESKEGGEVVTSYLEKELAFNVQIPEPEKKVIVTKEVCWVQDTNHYNRSSGNSSEPSSNLNQMRYVITVKNETGKNLSMTLKETLDKGMILKYYQNPEDFPAEFLVDKGNGEFVSYPLTRFANFGKWYHPYSTAHVVIQGLNDVGNGTYCYDTSGLMITVEDLKCDAFQIVYYADTYYSNDIRNHWNSNTDKVNGSRFLNSGSSVNFYAPSTTVETIESPSLEEGEYTKEVRATAVKNYSGFGNSISMNQYNMYSNGAVNAQGTSIYSSSGDSSGRIDYSYTINPGGEHWLAFEELPYGDDWGNANGYSYYSSASRNYYFHARDFYSGDSSLTNSFKVKINDYSLSLSRTGFYDMSGNDIASYEEFLSLVRDSGYSDTSSYVASTPVYRGTMYIGGRTRTIWVVVSPETNELATLSIDRYGRYFAPLVASGSAGKGYTYIGGKQTPSDNVPAGIKVYVFGLVGNESVTFDWSVFQRSLTPSPEDAIRTKHVNGTYAQLGNGPYGCVGACVYPYTSKYQSYTNKTSDDYGSNSLLDKRGEMLPDGSVKWTVILDARKLKSFYASSSNAYYSGSNLNSYNTYCYLYEDVPYGYSLNPGSGYDREFNYIKNGSATYTGGVVYIHNSTAADDYSRLSSFSSSFNPYEVAIIKDKANYGASLGDTYNILRKAHYDSAYGKEVIEFMYIMTPNSSSYSLSSGITSLYGQTEFVIPWGAGHESGMKVKLVDTAAAAYVYIPGIGKKYMFQDTNGSAAAGTLHPSNEWKTRIAVDSFDLFSNFNTNQQSSNRYPFFFNGSYSIDDNMQGVRVLDEWGNELDIKDASRYIQLKDIKVNISSMYYGSRTLMMSLDSTAPIARGDNGTLTFSGTGTPKFGFERYRCVSPDSSMSFTLDYAKKASASQTSPVTDWMEGITVGGDYYAMYGGFMLSVNGLKDATGITIDYTTVFDYEQFAKDHPELGRVSVKMVNQASRDYSRLNGDTAYVTSSAANWNFAVKPDMTKKCEEDKRSDDTYTNSFSAEADVGAADLSKICLADQIVKVTDGKEFEITVEENPQAIADWVKCLKLDNLKITLKNRIDKNVDEIVYENGTLTDGWSMEPVDVSSMGVSVPQEATALDGNLFAYELSKTDGSMIEGESYFEITYDLTIDHERVNGQTPFRHLGDPYNGGRVVLYNQMAICYKAAVSDDQGSKKGGGILRKLFGAKDADRDVDADTQLGWVAAGATAPGEYLKNDEASKGGSWLGEGGEEDEREHQEGTGYFYWYLQNKDWTSGTQEYQTHNWEDTMYVTAFLDADNVEDPANAALGDDSLNAAWVNLFYKYLTITDWEATVSDTISGGDVAEIPFTGETADGKLVFTGDDGLKVTVTPDAIEKSGNTWRFKKRNNDFTDLDKGIYDAWNVGTYVQKYYTKDEVVAGKADETFPPNAKDYGYGINHVFDMTVEHQDHLQTVKVKYYAEIDWTALFADADARVVLQQYVDYLKQNNVDSDVTDLLQAAVDKQKEYDEINERLGLTGDDAYKIGLYELPRYRSITNKAIADDKIVVSESSWDYGVEAGGSIEKTSKFIEESGDIEWNVKLTSGAKKFADLKFTDTLHINDGASDDVKANSEIAIRHMPLKSFEIRDKEGNVLYKYEGDEFTGTVDIGSAEGFYTNGTVDFSPEGKLLAVNFDIMEADTELVFAYTTDFDINAFVQEGGSVSTQISVSNTAKASGSGARLEAESTTSFEPDDETVIAKESYEYGKLGETGFTVTAKTGETDSKTMYITDTLTVPDEIKDYMSISSMKVTLKQPGEGDETSETVIYDSAGGVDDLADNHFTFDDAFALDTNGNYSFKLTFNEEEADKTVLKAGTEVIVDYTVSLDEDAYREAEGEDGTFSLTNHAEIGRNGYSVTDTDTTTDVQVREPVSKTGITDNAYSDGTVTRWECNVFLNELYTVEELKNAESATITDTLKDLSVMQFKDLEIYDMSATNGPGDAIPEDDYTVDVVGKKVIITLKNPADHPKIYLVIRTTTPEGIDASISNNLSVSILDKETSVTTDEKEIKGARDGYVRSRTYSGALHVKKYDAEDESIKLPGTVFKLYLKDGDDWTETPCLIKKDLNDTYVYEYDRDYSAENNGQSMWESDLITDKFGEFTVRGLPFGEYKLVETESPAGYVLPEQEKDRSYTFTIDYDSEYIEENGERIALFDYELANKPTKFKAYKYYDETIAGKDRNAPLEGVTFRIWNKDKTEMAAEAVTGADGFVTFEKIPMGEYILEEGEAPEGFNVAGDISFTLGSNGVTDLDAGNAGKDADGNIYIKMQDELALGKLTITKKGEIINDLGLIQRTANVLVHAFEWIAGTLKNVTFDIYAEEDIVVNGETVFAAGQKVDSITTGADGVAVLEGLPAGQYYAKEASAPDDYIVSDSTYKFTLENIRKADGTVIVNCVGEDEILNERKQVTIELLKQDGDDKTPLADAEFGLYSAKKQKIFTEDDLIDVATTGDDGKASFGVSLPAGSYYLKEIKAPAGYSLNSKKYEVDITKDTEDGAVITAEAVNYRTTRVQVKKVWIDNQNSDGIRPASVTIKLYANGKETGDTAELSDANEWIAVFDNLPAYDGDLQKISYTVSEVTVADYSTSITGDAETGFIVKNRHNPSEKPSKPGKPDKPDKHDKKVKTGDETGILLYTLILCCTASALAALLIRRKKRNNR